MARKTYGGLKDTGTHPHVQISFYTDNLKKTKAKKTKEKRMVEISQIAAHFIPGLGLVGKGKGMEGTDTGWHNITRARRVSWCHRGRGQVALVSRPV